MQAAVSWPKQVSVSSLCLCLIKAWESNTTSFCVLLGLTNFKIPSSPTAEARASLWKRPASLGHSASSILTLWAVALNLWCSPVAFLPFPTSLLHPVSVEFSAWLLAVASVLNSPKWILQAHSPMLSSDPSAQGPHQGGDWTCRFDHPLIGQTQMAHTCHGAHTHSHTQGISLSNYVRLNLSSYFYK